MLASVINLFVARRLLSEGRKRNSISLEADGHHLMTDVWTSVGVIAAVGIVALTGWLVLDPLIAFAVALNIIWTGIQLVSRSTSGLMDAALPEKELEIIRGVMEKYRKRRVTFHALRTRQAAAGSSFQSTCSSPAHGAYTTRITLPRISRTNIRAALGGVVTVFTHIEPVEDELSMEDIHLDR